MAAAGRHPIVGTVTGNAGSEGAGRREKKDGPHQRAALNERSVSNRNAFQLLEDGWILQAHFAGALRLVYLDAVIRFHSTLDW
jgi:hypothetical protein